MPIQPAYTPANVLVGQAAVYLQPFVQATPPTLPNRTLALGALWSDPWTPIGATSEGVSFEVERSTQDITIEEQMTPVDKRTTGMSFAITTELAEDTLSTMKLAFGGGTLTQVAPTAGQPGYETLVIADEMERLGLGFEGQNEHGMPRRVLIPTVVSEAKVKTAYRRANGQRTYEVSLTSLVPPSDVLIENITAAALP